MNDKDLQRLQLIDRQNVLYTGNLNSSFSIDKTQGNIYTRKPLDRELHASYALHVIACSSPSQPSNEDVKKIMNRIARLKNDTTNGNDTAIVRNLIVSIFFFKFKFISVI